MRILASLLSMGLFFAISARATELTKEEHQLTFRFLCAVNPEEGIAPPEGQELNYLTLRGLFQKFVANPVPKIEYFKKQMGEETGGFPTIEDAMAFAAMCENTKYFQEDIRKQGCHDSLGNQLSVEKALALCLPLIEQVNRDGSPEEEQPEDFRF